MRRKESRQMVCNVAPPRRLQFPAMSRRTIGWIQFWIVVAILIGTIVYLPWNITFRDGSSKVAYAFAWRPPTQGYLHDWSTVKIAIQSRSVGWSALMDEWAAVLILIATFMYTHVRTSKGGRAKMDEKGPATPKVQ